MGRIHMGSAGDNGIDLLIFPFLTRELRACARASCASQSPTLRPRRERWKQVMLANRALVKLHRPIPRAVDVTDYRIIDQFQLNHRLGE